MSAERPSFEPQKASDSPFVANGVPTNGVPESWEHVEIPKDSSPSKQPTERQLFWRNMYQTGEMSPYKKNKGPIKLDALKKAAAEAFSNPAEYIKHLPQHIRAVDIDFRGGVDIGDYKTRVQRAAVMLGNMVPFWTFDVITSIPSGLLFEFLGDKQRKFEKNYPQATEEEKKNARVKNATWKGLQKVIDVQNDKVVTALGDILVTKLTGEKGAWTHEASDKSADFLGTAMEDYLKDAINGPVIESAMRFLYQIPIFGALVEQGWTRLSRLQEKSPLNKGIAKSFYMGAGMLVSVWRDMEGYKDKLKKGDEPMAPSSKIARNLWGLMFPDRTNKGKQVAK